MKEVSITLDDLQVIEFVLSKFNTDDSRVKGYVDNILNMVNPLVDFAKEVNDGSRLDIRLTVDDNPCALIVGVLPFMHVYRHAYTQYQSWLIHNELTRMGCKEILMDFSEVDKLPKN